MNTWLKAAVFTAAAASISLSAQAGTVVYDSSSSSGSVPQWLTSTNSEFGDEIKLASNTTLDHTISQFKLEYYLNATISYNETIKVSIYANDGAGSAPGTLLWSSGTISITSPSSVNSTGYQTITFTDLTTKDGAALVVPTSFTYTVSFGGIDTSANEGAGLILRDQPTVGENYSDYWVKTEDGWHTQVIDGTPVVFGAQVQSVPEPTVIQLGALGALSLLGSLALRRRSSK